MEAATSQFEEMKQLGVIDVVAYNILLKGHLALDQTAQARALIQEMSAHGLQANKVTYNELLHAKVLAKDRDGIWSLVDEMFNAGVKANSVSCSILLKSLTVNSDLDDVKRVISLIDDLEDPIDEALLTSFIEACIRIRQLDLLSDAMRAQRLRGTSVVLTSPTYGSMIKAYGQAGNISRVQELWEEM